MRSNSFGVIGIILLAGLSAFSGCLGGPSKTPATRYYVLNSLYNAEKKTAPVVKLKAATVGVGPIKLTQVLDRPQIIIRTGQNEIRVAGLDRWAAPLQENISDVLTENLTTLLSTGTILKFPWKTNIPIDYQVVLEITRFDGMPGGNVDMKARWGILGENGRKVYAKSQTILTEPIGGDTVAAMVSALSRLIAMLSLEIAKEIERLEDRSAAQ